MFAAELRLSWAYSRIIILFFVCFLEKNQHFPVFFCLLKKIFNLLMPTTNNYVDIWPQLPKKKYQN